MKCKLICIILSFIMLLSMISVAYATETVSTGQLLVEKENEMLSSINVDEEIFRAENGLTDVLISEKIKKQISAYTTCADGSRKKADVKATIRNLGTITKDGTTGTMYTLTAVTNGRQTSDSGEETLHKVKAFATVTWIDNLGTENELVSVSGGWDPSSWTLDERRATYGVFDGDTDHQISCSINSNSFSYDGNDDMIGMTLGVYTWAKIVEYDEMINLYVHSTFWS